MESLISQYGFLAILVGAAIEGDVVVILSGVAAHLQLVDFPSALAAGWLGAVSTDWVWYAIGRRHSAQAQQTQTYQLVQTRIENLVGRLGAGEIVIARFIVGTRVVSMLYWGIRRLPFAQFAVLDLIGCAIWATALASLGYAFSGSAAMLVGEVKRVEMWLGVALVVFGVVALVTRQLLRRSMTDSGSTR